MPGIARVGDRARCPEDSHGCPGCSHDVIGPAETGSPTVTIDGRPALRLGDRGIHASCCGQNEWQVADGCSTKVKIDGLPAAMLGSITQHCGGMGTIVEASGGVIIADDPCDCPCSEEFRAKERLLQSAPGNQTETPAAAQTPAPNAAQPSSRPPGYEEHLFPDLYPQPAPEAHNTQTRPQDNATTDPAQARDNTPEARSGPAPTPPAAGAATANTAAGTPPVTQNPNRPDLVIGVFFDGTGNNMLADPEDRHTNVARLHDLYLFGENIERFYIQGVGTRAEPSTQRGSDPFSNRSMDKKESPIGLGIGMGTMGADRRLKEARDSVLRSINDYTDQFGNLPERVVFDVFGFSRGAVLARHFANMVNDGLPDRQGTITKEPSPIFPAFRSVHPKTWTEQMRGIPERRYPALNAEVTVRFLGIFDSVGSFFWPGNADEGYVNPYLTGGSAQHVCHFTARNEIRKNFPLTRVADNGGTLPPGFEETAFFGAHSDVGGGYDATPEMATLLRTEPARTDMLRTYASWKKEMREIALINRERVEFDDYTAWFFGEKRTRPDLSRVTLAAMHERALANGVPLRPILPADRVPDDLLTLVSHAEAGDADAMEQLHAQYIHTSHDRFSLIHAPEENGVRDEFPNRPDRAIRPATVTQTARSTP